jgi:hypothetical protein
MRRADAPHRERRRIGLRGFRIELRETEIDTLMQLGLLGDYARQDCRTILSALYAFFDRTLGCTM